MRVFILTLLFALSAFAAEPAVKDSAAVDSSAVADTSVAQADSASADKAKKKSIPLPRQSAYTGYGLLVGLAAGIFNPTKECDCLGVWQGQFEFFYRDWISAGGDVRFFGGDLDTDVMLRYQRYRVNTRFHFPHSIWDWYVGPIMELENTDLEDIREEWHQRDMEGWIPGASTKTEQKTEDCEKMFSLDGFSIGAEAGAGVSFLGFLGATGRVLYEYNFGGAQLLTLAPGVAFDLQEVWPWAKQRLSAMWVSFEMGFQRFFNRSVDSWAMAGYLGAVIGF
jgi:hypothetical protein